MTNEKGPVATGPEDQRHNHSITVRPGNQVAESLAMLAAEANEAYRQAEASKTTVVEAANATLGHAMRCGELLTEAKNRCPYGKFEEWRDQNFTGSKSTATLYISLWRNRAAIAAKVQRAGHLSLRSAVKLLAGPKKRPAAKADKPKVKRFLDLPLEQRQQQCKTWWDRLACYALMLDAADWPAEKIAENLGVNVDEVDAILDPRPVQYNFTSDSKLPSSVVKISKMFDDAVIENVAFHLVNACSSAQYAARHEGFNHVVPALEATEAKYKRLLLRLGGSDFRLMQALDEEATTDEQHRIWPIAISCCVTDAMRETLRIDPRPDTTDMADFFPIAFAVWCKKIEQPQAERELEAVVA